MYPPLGVCYLASCIMQNNPDDEVKIVDAEADGKNINMVVEEAAGYAPHLIGITSTTPIFHQAKKLAVELKKRINSLIIVGGSHPTVMPLETMQECPAFDFCIVGEGENTIVELIEAIRSGDSFSGIKGLVFRQNGQIIRNQARPLVKDLDSIPLPRRNLLKLDRYLWGVPNKGIVKFTTIMTFRGCPFKCIFCSARNVFGTTVRKRDALKVVDEIEDLLRTEGIDHFSFIDDTLTLDKVQVKKICEEIKRRGLKITFEGFTRANTVDEEILSIMKDAGLVRLSFGIESGNPEILRKMKKGITLEQIKRAYEITKSVGIETRGSAMIGFPYETKKTVMQTLRFIKSLDKCDQIYLNITTPYPGTELYDMALRGEGGVRLLTRDFSEYKRYGGPVMEVNDLTKEDLIWLQKKGFRMFYLTPKRIFYNIKRAGIKAGIKNAIAFVKSVYSE